MTKFPYSPPAPRKEKADLVGMHIPKDSCSNGRRQVDQEEKHAHKNAPAHLSYSQNPLKGRYVRELLGDYIKGYYGGY